MAKINKIFGSIALGGATALGATGAQAAAPAPQRAAPEAKNTVDVKRTDVRATADGVVIKNAGLAAQLKTDRAATVAALSRRLGGLTDGQVKLLPNGVVAISSTKVKRSLGASANAICNGICSPRSLISRDAAIRRQ